MKVFINYAREDKVAARKLYAGLVGAGHEPWLDEECLLPGMNWKAEITRAMELSEVIVLLMSPTSVSKDGYVHKEVRDAVELSYNKPPGSIHLIPVKLGPCELNVGNLKDLHAEDMYPDWDKGMKTLLRALQFAEAQKSGISTRPEATQGLPIAQNLQTSARIYKGEVKYTKSSIQMPALLDMTIPVDHGYIVRNEQGQLEATVWMRHPMQSMREMSEKLGLDGSVRLVSQSSVLSIDPEHPTTFEGSRLISMPKGIEIPNLQNIGQKTVLPVTVNAASRMLVIGYLCDKTFRGNFSIEAVYSIPGLTLVMEGKFELAIE